MIFRIHFADGSKLDLQAETAEAARKAAAKRFPDVHIVKIKRVKG